MPKYSQETAGISNILSKIYKYFPFVVFQIIICPEAYPAKRYSSLSDKDIHSTCFSNFSSNIISLIEYSLYGINLSGIGFESFFSILGFSVIKTFCLINPFLYPKKIKLNSTDLILLYFSLKLFIALFFLSSLIF